MLRFLQILFSAVLFTTLPALAAAQSPQAPAVYPSVHHDYRVVPVAEGLVRPWAIAFLPDGSMLVTEKPGRLRIVRDGRLLPEPVAGVPEVHAEGQGGLLDVAPHPNFPSNRLLYLTYSKPIPGEDGATTALVRGRLENDRLTDLEELFVAESRGSGHYGSRIAFDGAGHVFITVGDRQAPSRGDLEAHPAQDLSNHHGVVIRLNEDGSVPDDNPFVGRTDALPGIWSYGHRNAQGLAFRPGTEQLWLNEHGPQGGDEVNLIQPGENYGWPVVGYGVNYRSGTTIHEGPHRDGMEPPVHVWVPSIAPSGLLFYTGDAFPEWRGDMFVGGLAGQQLARLQLDGEEIVYEETLVPGLGRIRDVVQGPDGYIYLAMEDRDGAPSSIFRLEPVPGG